MIQHAKTTLCAFMDFLDNRSVIRRVVLFFTLYLTLDCYRWASEFATLTTKTGVEVAAIVAAVTAPISVLQAAVFKAYIEGQKQ